MLPNPQENADLVSLTEEILNEKFHFLCSDGKQKKEQKPPKSANDSPPFDWEQIVGNETFKILSGTLISKSMLDILDHLFIFFFPKTCCFTITSKLKK